jgi:hypothetical protein
MLEVVPVLDDNAGLVDDGSDGALARIMVLPLLRYDVH